MECWYDSHTLDVEELDFAPTEQDKRVSLAVS